MPDISTPAACPCDPARAYARCCGPLHAGGPVGSVHAGSAQALMRARYSAYVLGDAAYLRQSWHRDTCPAELELDARVRWLGLKVRAECMTGEDTAVVEFVARCRSGGGRAERLHEISRFVREDGRWYYVDGIFPEN